MTVEASSIWPVLVLAAIQFADGLMCIGPLPFIRQCLEDVGFDRRWWRALPAIKFAATAGLIGGIWIPGLGLLTGAALVAYFTIAVAMHIRARDIGRNFINATGMLAICIAVTAVCFI